MYFMPFVLHLLTWPCLSRLLVKVSLVCESKAGFSMRQLMKIQR